MIRKKRINRDHAKKKNSPQIENEAIANYLEDLLIPAMAAQKSLDRQLNLRDSICDKLRKSANCQGGTQKNVK
jgi:hypothetical protein